MNSPFNKKFVKVIIITLLVILTAVVAFYIFRQNALEETIKHGSVGGFAR